jgi:hypothetical protein
MAAAERSSPLVLGLLLCLTAGALVMRLVGIGCLLPNHQEPDAVIVWQASYLERPAGEPETDVSYSATYYPRLLARMLWLLPGHSYPQVLPATASLEEHLAAAGEPYRRARYLVALLSVLAVPATFFLARRFLSPGWSLLAAAFMATSLLNLAYAAQARPHCASTALSLIAMLPVLALVRSGKFSTYVAAGVLTGITLGCLQNGVFVVPALVLAHVLSPKRNWKGFAAALAIVAISVLGFYWFLFQKGITNPEHPGEIDIGGQTLNWDLINGDGFRQIFYGFWAYEPVLCAIAACGAVIGIARLARRETRPDAETLRELGASATFPLSFAAAWGWMSVVQPRFVNPLIPYLCILGAYGASVLIPKLNTSLDAGRRRFAAVLSSLVLLAVPAYASIKLACLRAHDDTLTLAARWLEQHADRQHDLILCGITLCLPIPMQVEGIEARPVFWRFPWEHYQLKLPREVTDAGYRVHPLFRSSKKRVLSTEDVKSMLDEEHGQYAVAIVPTGKGVGQDHTREALRAEAGEPVFAAIPFDLSQTQLNGSAYEQSFHAFERVMRSDLWGPPVEIYRLK